MRLKEPLHSFFVKNLSKVTLASALAVSVVGYGQVCSPPSYTNLCSSNDYIDGVQFNTITNLGTGCGNSSTSYTDYSGSFSTNVTPGTMYPITLTSSPNWGQNFGVAIDYNQDGDFLDPGEFEYIGYAASGQSVTDTITIPQTALPGPNTLRVVCRYGNTTQIQQIDMCSGGANLAYGETEDYEVIILGGSPNDAGLSSIVSPPNSNNLSATQQMTFKLFNYGTDTINSCNLTYTVNGSAPVTETYTGSVPNLGSTDFAFSATHDMSALGTYNVQAWVTLAGDTTPINDTITGVFENRNDIEAVSFISPDESCGLDGTVSVTSRFFNHGTNTITDTNLMVSLYHNGVLVVTDTIGNDTAHIQSNYDHTFSMTVDASATGTHNFMVVANAHGDTVTNNDTANLTLYKAGVLPYFTSFESDNGGWRTTGTNSSWEWGVPASTNAEINAASDGQKAWVTNLDGNYNTNEVSYLEAPCLDFSGDTTDPSVRFSMFRNSQDNWDGMVLEMSLDTGNTWSVVGSDTTGSNWYNDNNNNTIDTCWSDYSAVWQKAEHVLHGAGGASLVKLRFRFESNGWTELEGFGIDEFAVSHYPTISMDSIVCGTNPFGNDFGPGSYEWVTTSGSSTTTNTNMMISFTPRNMVEQISTTYTYTNIAGFSATTTQMLTILPNVKIGGDLEYCEGSSTTLNAVLLDANGSSLSGTTFTWNGGTQGATKTANTAEVYYVTAADPYGCNLTDTVQVIENSSPVVDLGSDTAVCQGNSVTLEAGTGFSSYSWSQASTNQTLTVKTPGTYSVTVTDSKGCEGSDDVLVTINPNPVVDLGNDTNIVPNVSINLDAGSGYTSYEWNTGATTQTIDYVTGFSDISISVTVTDANGCQGSDEVLIINPEPLTISGVNADDMKITAYPNPVDAELNLSFDLDKTRNVNVELLDITGRVVLIKSVGNVNQSVVSLNTTELTAGAYFLNIKVDGEVIANQKLIKK